MFDLSNATAVGAENFAALAAMMAPTSEHLEVFLAVHATGDFVVFDPHVFI